MQETVSAVSEPSHAIVPIILLDQGYLASKKGVKFLQNPNLFLGIYFFSSNNTSKQDADHSGANGSPLNLGRRISNHRAFFVRGAFRDTWLDGFVNPSAQAIGRYLVHGQRI